MPRPTKSALNHPRRYGIPRGEGTTISVPANSPRQATVTRPSGALRSLSELSAILSPVLNIGNLGEFQLELDHYDSSANQDLWRHES